MSIERRNWGNVHLGDVVHQVKDKVDAFTYGLEYYLGGEHFNTDDLHVNGCGEIAGSTIGPAFIMRFKPGDVLLVSRNPHLRKMAVANFEGICSNVTYVLRADTDYILQEYLPFVVHSTEFWSFAIQNKRGSTNFYLNWSDFERYSFRLPSLDEQRHIAELLWAADKVIMQSKGTLSCLYQIKELISNSLVKELSSGINEVFLGDLIEYASGQVDPRQEPYNKMPLVAPNHIESNTGKLLGIETAEEQHSISGKYIFKKGNIIYSKIRPALNKVIIADFDGLCSADMYPITPKDNRLNVRFLYYVLSSKLFINYATIESVRTSIPKLNRNAMSKFKFAYISPKDQKKYVQELDFIQESIDSTITYISETQNMFKILVDRMIGGAHDV